MVGADDAETYEATKAIVSMMGKPQNVFHCGKIGSGVAVKAINNYLSVTWSIKEEGCSLTLSTIGSDDNRVLGSNEYRGKTRTGSKSAGRHN